jgi:phage terminase small subunit
LSDKNRSATAAYRKAYPKCKNNNSAAASATKLLRNAKVQDILRESEVKAMQDAEITNEKVFREMGRVAFFDPRKLFDENGNLKAIKDLDDDTAAAISSIEITEKPGDKGVVVTKIKMASKTTGLEQLAKVLKMYIEKAEVADAEKVTFNLNLVPKE